MKIVILHGEVPEGAPPDETDVLVQVESVSDALSRLGHECDTLAFSFDVRRAMEELSGRKPEAVFNLVESVSGLGQFIHIAPAVLDYLRLPYTGASSEAMFLTSNKLAAKNILKASGICTPPWLSSELTDTELRRAQGRFIIKSVWEHASVGLGTDSVVCVEDVDELRGRMVRRGEALGRECFAEVYIEGREFNLSVLAGENGPRVLPPAEIRFASYPPDAVKIVDYDSKWNAESFAYHHTPRSFDFSAKDNSLLERLESTARECWNLFGLRGYARVDFRVDREGQPWVLEINANPCISPDGGYVAAAERAGLRYDDVIEAIVRGSLLQTRRQAT